VHHNRMKKYFSSSEKTGISRHRQQASASAGAVATTAASTQTNKPDSYDEPAGRPTALNIEREQRNTRRKSRRPRQLATTALYEEHVPAVQSQACRQSARGFMCFYTFWNIKYNKILCFSSYLFRK
jgi:hypothetical protein